MNEFKYDFKNRGKNSKKKSNFFERFFESGLGKATLLVLTILLLLSVYRSFRHTIDRINLLKQAEYEVNMLRLENLRLSLKIVDSSSPEYLEKEARNKLNYGRDNEVMFVIPEELIAQGKQQLSAIYQGEEVELSRDEIFARWVEFVVEGY